MIYHGEIRSITCLLMPWLLSSPVHQQTWNLSPMSRMFWSCFVDNIAVCCLYVEQWWQMQNIYFRFIKQFSMERVNISTASYLYGNSMLNLTLSMLNCFMKLKYIFCICHHCSTYKQQTVAILATKQDQNILDIGGKFHVLMHWRRKEPGHQQACNWPISPWYIMVLHGEG